MRRENRFDNRWHRFAFDQVGDWREGRLDGVELVLSRYVQRAKDVDSLEAVVGLPRAPSGIPNQFAQIAQPQFGDTVGRTAPRRQRGQVPVVDVRERSASPRYRQPARESGQPVTLKPNSLDQSLRLTRGAAFQVCACSNGVQCSKDIRVDWPIGHKLKAGFGQAFIAPFCDDIALGRSELAKRLGHRARRHRLKRLSDRIFELHRLDPVSAVEAMATAIAHQVRDIMSLSRQILRVGLGKSLDRDRGEACARRDQFERGSGRPRLVKLMTVPRCANDVDKRRKSVAHPGRPDFRGIGDRSCERGVGADIPRKGPSKPAGLDPAHRRVAGTWCHRAVPPSFKVGSPVPMPDNNPRPWIAPRRTSICGLGASFPLTATGQVSSNYPANRPERFRNGTNIRAYSYHNFAIASVALSLPVTDIAGINALA